MTKKENKVFISEANYDDEDEWDYRDEMTWKEMEAERIEEELENFTCTCGAYVISKKSHRVIHIADCLCGYG